MAVVRDAAGKIVERFGRDMPVQTPPRMLDEMRKRDSFFRIRPTSRPAITRSNRRCRIVSRGASTFQDAFYSDRVRPPRLPLRD